LAVIRELPITAAAAIACKNYHQQSEDLQAQANYLLTKATASNTRGDLKAFCSYSREYMYKSEKQLNAQRLTGQCLGKYLPFAEADRQLAEMSVLLDRAY
jgi:hypothetical protein